MSVFETIFGNDSFGKTNLKKFQEEYRNETKTLEDIRRSIVSYSGHLSHGHTYKLKKKVMANFVLTKTVKRAKEDFDEKERND